MNRDLLDDRFGRFREIPLALARRGHEVRGLCLSYEARDDGRIVDTDPGSGETVLWESVNLGPLVIGGLARFVTRSRNLVRDFQPDVIWAGSDATYGPIARLAGRKSNARTVCDVYDHFESFSSARIPGVMALHRHACRVSDGVTSYNEIMTQHVREVYGRTGPILTLVNAVDKNVFRPLDRLECRRELGLPESGALVGIAGALSGREGMTSLFDAFYHAARTDSAFHLVLAGPRDERMEIPVHPMVHDLGIVDHTEVPKILSALDVGVALPRSGPAGSFSYPYRLNEMLACGIPVVATKAGVVNDLLVECPESLFDPEDDEDIYRAITHQLGEKCIPTTPVPDWDAVAHSLEGFFEAVTTDS